MTVEAVCERLGKRQFEEGEDIFAVQWSGIHKMAQTGDIRGLRCDGLPKSCCKRMYCNATKNNLCMWLLSLYLCRKDCCYPKLC